MHLLTLLPVVLGLPVFAALINTQYPVLLLPLKKFQPDTAFPTQKDATVSYSNKTGNEQWTAVSFYVPDNDANVCRLRFLINTDPSKNAPFSLKGEPPFVIDISRVEPRLDNGRTTWNNKPAIIERYDTYVLSTTGASEIRTKWFACPRRDIAQFFIHPANTRDLEVYWFELNYEPEYGGPHGVVLELYT
ncbi:ubiquitin 3 binding protein But2 C-terminal domain-containing protein [Bipolaris maydis]|nr:ubiquitin 3 binding protein But2 C-terminal domain-containing protein [Bipolaris maydis]KAJ6285715.1 ubiquitin 3 binding protein But2 C-terminal domain-containing protein [Bipolaris maydis]